MTRAFALVARGRLENAEAELKGIDANALDAPHRNELAFYRGSLALELLGWGGARSQFEAIAQVDPRAAYWFWWLRTGGRPDADGKMALGRAMQQVQQLLQAGYRLEWLQYRLQRVKEQIPDLSPEASAPQPQLLPDDPPRRWDVLKHDLSEGNISRSLYLDLLEALTDYILAFLPAPEPPRLWWESPPSEYVEGPREFLLGADVPVALALGGRTGPVRLTVLRDGGVVRDLPRYAGEEMQLPVGVRHQFILWADGFWPVYVDTFFVQPHQTLAVGILPALNIAGSGIALGGAEGSISVWKTSQGELQFNRLAHRYEFIGRNLTLGQELGKPTIHIGKFAMGADGTVWLLDVANNRAYGLPGEDEGSPRSLDLGSIGIAWGTDISPSSTGFILADADGRKLVPVDPDLQPAGDPIALDGRPTAVLCLPRYGDLVWAADAYDSVLWFGKLPSLHRIPGLQAAWEEGLRSPARLIWLEGLNYVGVTDHFSDRLFLFLPNGEYVGSLSIQGGRGPIFWAEFGEDSRGPYLNVSRGPAVFSCQLTPVGHYAFQLRGEYPPAAKLATLSGGWLVFSKSPRGR
ncbi:MAG: hypothetical protein ONB23_13500 [candidate division KSB1 bacterium]|nr:hypothetical protein [candidate division KSB1 bacterium]